MPRAIACDHAWNCVAIGRRDVEQVGDDGDRQRIGEVGDDVDLAGELGARHGALGRGADALEQRGDERLDVRADRRTRGPSVALSMARTGS